MSKTTKIIAALGVVAGLGVAALPAFTYAAETVSGNVDLLVEVNPAIAMTISGNNDNGDHAAAPSYYAVTPEEGDNPSDKGWYELVDDEYVPSEDTTVASGKTYYAQSTTGTVQVKNPAAATTIDGVNVSSFDVGTSLNHSSSYMALLPNASGTMTSTVTVYTNNASGYTLSLKDADSDTNLTKIYSGTTPATPATIIASATPTAGSGAGWSVTGGDDDFASGAAITAVNRTVKTTAAKTSGGDATTMTYTVATAVDQETGVYTDTITYTATTNN